MYRVDPGGYRSIPFGRVKVSVQRSTPVRVDHPLRHGQARRARSVERDDPSRGRCGGDGWLFHLIFLLVWVSRCQLSRSVICWSGFWRMSMRAISPALIL